jgi:hypothetical protein
LLAFGKVKLGLGWGENWAGQMKLWQCRSLGHDKALRQAAAMARGPSATAAAA